MEEIAQIALPISKISHATFSHKEQYWFDISTMKRKTPELLAN